jgi:hypothetical protein
MGTTPTVPPPRPQPVEIVLPDAPPQLYLGWTAFTVAAEQKLRDRPHLRARASRAGFVTTPAAHLAHSTMLGPLTEQAESALREGATMVAPVIAGDHAELSAALDYLQQWGEWLATSDAFQEAGISLPAPEVAAIRTLALKALRENLDHTA